MQKYCECLPTTTTTTTTTRSKRVVASADSLVPMYDIWQRNDDDMK